ncbi:MAG TPA: hypothetical protein VGO58_15605, partial [Chitinophagaceae bacterium]|nr:hypothetical protein [Chitinophagaceae bacterium]
NWKQIGFCFLLTVFLTPQLLYSQKSFVSVGPTLTVSDNSANEKGRKGVGGSFEYSHHLFSNSGLRVYGGVEQFHTPGRSNDQIKYFSLRGGYQHWLSKDRVQIWGDAGIAGLEYLSGGGYTLFTFSAGGGYLVSLSKMSFLQLQAFYVYTDSNEPFDTYGYYGWVTFRVAYGIRFKKKEK